jgi:hypothetical protein
MAETRPGPSLRIALAVLVVGAALAVPACVVLGWRFFGSLTAPSFSTPGVQRRHLGTGTWFVFQRTGTSSGGAGFTVTFNDGVTLTGDDIEVTGPDGTLCPVRPVTVHETITRNSTIYTAAVQFTAPAQGVYTLQVPVDRSRLIVTRSLGSTFRRSLAWMATGAAGGAIVVIGGVLLLVRAVRRSRTTRTPIAFAYTQRAAPGWYPDPWGIGRMRFFDGTQWTGHTS